MSGTWDDGFIHAGNLAYMSLLSLFPFFIALAAILSALGEQDQMGASIDTILRALPPRVGDVLRPVVNNGDEYTNHRRKIRQTTADLE